MNRSERRDAMIAALQFLARTKLEGAEVEAFNLVVNVIRDVITEEESKTEAKPAE